MECYTIDIFPLKMTRLNDTQLEHNLRGLYININK